MSLLRALFGGDDDDRDPGAGFEGDPDELDDDLDGDYDDEDDFGIGEVVIFCDNRCGNEFRADMAGANAEARFAAARAYLEDYGWVYASGLDTCGPCRGVTA